MSISPVFGLIISVGSPLRKGRSPAIVFYRFVEAVFFDGKSHRHCFCEAVARANAREFPLFNGLPGGLAQTPQYTPGAPWIQAARNISRTMPGGKGFGEGGRIKRETLFFPNNRPAKANCLVARGAVPCRRHKRRRRPQRPSAPEEKREP